jgi:hypothetical protein
VAATRYNLFMLRGRVRQAKRNIAPTLCDQIINDIVRRVIESRIYWSDLMFRGVISFPNPYIAGTVSVATGSAIVTGAGTAWPTNDVVNTVVPDGINDTGYQEVVPASMAGITEDSILLVDPGTPSQETVPVTRLAANSFVGSFKFTHPVNVVIQQSSLAGLQFRLSTGDPIYTVLSVQSPTALELDNVWGGAPQTAKAYQVLKVYINMRSTFKDFFENGVVDQQTGYPLELHVSQATLNTRDPQRTDSGDPRLLSDCGANLNGNPQFEVSPIPGGARQLAFMAYAGWPELVRDTDPGPWFIDPAVIINGAIGEALMLNLGNRVEKDPWFLPNVAREYDMRYAKSLAIAVNADESKALKQYDDGRRWLFGMGGGSYWLQHDEDVLSQRF